MTLRYAAAAVLAAGILAGCGSSFELPDPADPQIAADAMVIARAVEADTIRAERSGAGPDGDWACEATLWGRDGQALLGEVRCTGTYEGDPEESGFVSPVRIEGETITYADDGSGYADSIRRMWGRDLADAYLSR